MLSLQWCKIFINKQKKNPKKKQTQSSSFCLLAMWSKNSSINSPVVFFLFQLSYDHGHWNQTTFPWTFKLSGMLVASIPTSDFQIWGLGGEPSASTFLALSRMSVELSPSEVSPLRIHHSMAWFAASHQRIEFQTPIHTLISSRSQWYHPMTHEEQQNPQRTLSGVKITHC